MGLKRQVRLEIERPKNPFPGMAAANSERVLVQYANPDDNAALYGGIGTSSAAPNGQAVNRSFVRYAMVEDVLVFNGQASLPIGAQLIPANAVIDSVHMNWDQPLVLNTAVKVGVGPAASPSQLALSGTVMTKNTKTDNPQTTLVAYAAATQLQVNACATGGTAAGTITSGTVRVRVYYYYYASIPNAL